MHAIAKDIWHRREVCRVGSSPMERRARVAEYRGLKRKDCPLLGPRAGVEWHHSNIESAFEVLLHCGCGLETAEARRPYSLHSFRIFLACALKAANCPRTDHHRPAAPKPRKRAREIYKV